MKKLLFKSRAAYITTEDGFINWSKLKIDSENMYGQNFNGAELSVISKLESNLQQLKKEAESMIKQLENYKDSVQQKELF